MRLNHWSKNLVVFAAALFGMQFSLSALVHAVGAFWAFGFAASAVYLVNDVMDVHADREHPVKSQRPIAAGKVTIHSALMAAGLLFLLSLGLSLLVSPYVGVCVLSYIILQVAYTVKLKHHAIVDMLCIAFGFVLRALAGAAAVSVVPSSWFILCVGLLALYLSIEKRKAELTKLGPTSTTRKVLQEYSLPWLVRMEAIVTASVLMTYCLWTIEGAQTVWQMVTIPFVIYGLFKYQFLAEQGQGETPEIAVFKSVHLRSNLILWVGVNLVILVLTRYGILH